MSWAEIKKAVNDDFSTRPLNMIVNPFYGMSEHITYGTVKSSQAGTNVNVLNIASGSGVIRNVTLRPKNYYNAINLKIIADGVEKLITTKESNSSGDLVICLLDSYMQGKGSSGYVYTMVEAFDLNQGADVRRNVPLFRPCNINGQNGANYGVREFQNLMKSKDSLIEMAGIATSIFNLILLKEPIVFKDSLQIFIKNAAVNSDSKADIDYGIQYFM